MCWMPAEGDEAISCCQGFALFLLLWENSHFYRTGLFHYIPGGRLPYITKLYCEKCFECLQLIRLPPPSLQGSWFNIEKDKLFCLLGPNGAGNNPSFFGLPLSNSTFTYYCPLSICLVYYLQSSILYSVWDLIRHFILFVCVGKTTTINCLTGTIPTSAGNGKTLTPSNLLKPTEISHKSPCDWTPLSFFVNSYSQPGFYSSTVLYRYVPFILCVAAMVYGESIRSTSGVANIRKNMGVCPQVHNPFIN